MTVRDDHVGPARPVRLSPATYRRRRAVAALAVAGSVSMLGIAAQVVLTGPGGVPASAAGTGRAPPGRTLRAEPGDSLWSLAARFHGEVDFGRYLDALIDLNDGPGIVAGQLVRLP